MTLSWAVILNRGYAKKGRWATIKNMRAPFKDIYRPDAKVARFLSVLALSGIAFGLYRGIQDNYLAEIVHITAFERGIVEFFRETPGLLVVLLLSLMYRFSDSRIFKISVGFMTAGVAGLLLSSSNGYFGSKFFVVLFMVVFSTGEHIIMPVRTTISLDLARREKAGASLGITSAINQVGHIVGFLVVTGLFFVFSRYVCKRNDLRPVRTVFAV
jgi:hypothetical protein